MHTLNVSCRPWTCSMVIFLSRCNIPLTLVFAQAAIDIYLSAASPKTLKVLLVRSVEEVAGKQHREDANAQQAPVQGGSVQLHWQHSIIWARLRQRLQHHRGLHGRNLQGVACEGSLTAEGRALDHKDLLLRGGGAGGEEPNAGRGGKDEEHRTLRHCDLEVCGIKSLFQCTSSF